MLPIQTLIIPVNQFSRPGINLKAKRGIVMHYTADPGALARAIGNYFANLKDQNPNDNVPDGYASAHIQIDRRNIVQSLPLNEMGYHCGSDSYLADALAKLGSYPNDSTIGIEMCIEADGSIHEDTFQNAADTVAYLIHHEGFPEVLFTHKGVVGWKDCPLPWVRKPSEFERFKRAVHDRLYPPVPAPIPPPPQVVELPTPILDEEDDQLKLVDWQWEMLAQQLHELYTKGLISDYGWVEKAANKTLTISELVFVNTAIINRSTNK